MGLATFVLTDIEGSTLLWDRQEGEMARALVRHDSLIGEAVAAHGGRVHKTRGEGDSTFSVFELASQALAAAIDIQRLLAREEWPTGSALRVRIGVHTGEAEVRDGDYYGPTVNRAARLRGAAVGGQTLVSGATAALVEGALPGDVELVSLGPHALPGLRSPVDVFELVVPDVAPLRGRPHRDRPLLPSWLTSFVGRQDERRSVARRLIESRLLTVTGPGGVGKTRLAVQVASDVESGFRDGVWFVDLAGVGDPASVAGATAAALGVRDDLGGGVLTALESHCAAFDAVVLFDNCEHVIEGVAEVVRRLLVGAPGLRVLATSREPLGLPGEVLWPLAPLATSGAGTAQTADVVGADAVRLFVDRADAVSPGFMIEAANVAAVAALCRRVDGLPLAIELAAAQVDVLSPAQIERRLGEHVALLRSSERGGVERHRSLESVVEWSYNLLDVADRLVLDRLAVFRGTSSLEAIEAVVSDDDVPTREVLEVLARLVRRSLVMATGAGADRRYRLLETIREHSWRRLLGDGEIDRWRNRHLDWVLALAAKGAREVSGGDQAHWLSVLDEELDNLEEAFAWSSLDPLRAERALPAVIGLFDYWFARGTRRGHGVRWCSTLADAATTLAPSARAEAYLNASFIAVMSDLAASEALADGARRVAEQTGDERAAAIASVAASIPAFYKGDVAALRALTSDQPDMLDGWTRILAQRNVALLSSLEGENEKAYQLLNDVIGQVKGMGDDHLRYGIGATAVDVGAAAGVDNQRLRLDCREALAFASGFPCVSCEAVALGSLVLVDDCEEFGGRVAAARRSVALSHEIGETLHVVLNLGALIGALAADGDAEQAVYLAGATDALRTRTKYAHCRPGRRQLMESGLEHARAMLGDEAYERLWIRGRQISDVDLIAVALGGTSPAAVGSA